MMNPRKVFKTVLSTQSVLNNFLVDLSSRLCNILSLYIKKKKNDQKQNGQNQSLQVLFIPIPRPVLLPPFPEVTTIL